MQHLVLHVAVHLVEGELDERTKLISPGLDDSLGNNFDGIGIGAVIGDGRDEVIVLGLANAVVEQSWRQKLCGLFQGKRIRALCELSQPVDKGMERFDSKAILAQRTFKRAGGRRQIDARQQSGPFALRLD